ncbi:hypothetical protein BJY52DRAFT_1209913 [Lactarius psammicola]|nr:hypothetical protein BJY52DRAFT_1209913 [Lactarius psammicola]
MAYSTPVIFYSVGGEFEWFPGSNELSLGDTYLEQFTSAGSILSPDSYGFSDMWVTKIGGTILRYQDKAVSTLLQHLGGEYAGLYNIPDISAQALKFLIVVMAGTRCSTPTLVGIISLFDDFLLANGKALLGFLNLWQYGLDLAGLSDTTSSSDTGYNTGGWDPVTSHGTPDFEKLLRITR